MVSTELQSKVVKDALGLIRASLAEDVGPGDVTTEALIPQGAQLSAVMRAREPLVVAGIGVATAVFHEVGPELEILTSARDGAKAEAGESLLTVSGSARSILTAERVALNFMQRLSGVATLTATYQKMVAGTNARILDTRKTTPGWRALEKYAVHCGGGQNHRMGLYDLVLIKDNHLAWLQDHFTKPVEEAVRRARAKYPHLKIEVEVDHLSQLDQAIEAGADIILLDNMSVSDLMEAVRRNQRRSKLEASGGINLSTIRAVAETGVDFISVGAITHSAKSVDIGLDYEASR